MLEKITQQVSSIPWVGRIMIRNAIFVFICILSGSAASACTLTFAPDFRPPEGRVAAINLAVRHGAVATISNVPPGWQINIMNDPSWITQLSGKEVVGAAFLTISSLQGMFSIGPEPGYGCASLAAHNLVNMTLKLYTINQLRPFTIDPRQLSLVD